MRPALHFAKESLDHIVSADGLPVFLWVGIKGQTSLQIALEALGGSRVDLLILFDESGDGLIRHLPVLLIEQGPQFWLELLLLLGRHVAEPRCPFCERHSVDERSRGIAC